MVSLKRPSTEPGAIAPRENAIETLIDALSKALKSIGGHPTLWIGFSGGVDSTALLIASAKLVKRQPDYVLKAIHVNHHLQPEAATFQSHCLKTADRLGIPLEIVNAKVEQLNGESLEEAARNARYAAFQSLIHPGEALLLGHHREDQAETLLINLFRGSGVEGLQAMPLLIERSGRVILRPFLHLSRTTLKAAIEAEGIDHFEDPSNQSRRFDRNFLRHEILPLLRSRWPAIDSTLARSASLCSESAQNLRRHQEQLLIRAHDKGRLSIEALRVLCEPDQRLTVRGWLQSEGFRPPPLERLRQLIQETLNARADRNPCTRWQNAEVRRYRDHLYVMKPLGSIDSTWTQQWRGPEDCIVLPSGLGSLRIETGVEAGLPSGIWSQNVSVRLRRGGESFRLPGRKEHHDLRKFFQETGTPPWIRERTPLLYVDEELIAIGDQWLGDTTAFKSPTGTFDRIIWERSDLNVRSDKH